MITYEPPKKCFQGSPLRLCTLRMTLVGRYFWTWPLKYITSTSGNKWNKIWQSRDSTAIYGTKVYQFVLIAGALEVRSSMLDARYDYVFVWMKPSLGQSLCWEQRPRISRICRLLKLNARTHSPWRGKIIASKWRSAQPWIWPVALSSRHPPWQKNFLLRDFMTGELLRFQSIM